MNEKLKKGLTILLAIILGIFTGLMGAAVMNYLYNRKMEKMGLCPCCGGKLDIDYIEKEKEIYMG